MCSFRDTDKGTWSFEAFVVAQADEIAQWHHDLEDALRGNAMTSRDVCDAIEDNLVRIMSDEDKKRLDQLKNQANIGHRYITDLSRIVVNTLVNQLISCSKSNLESLWNSQIDKQKFFETHSAEEEDIKNAIAFAKKGESDEIANHLKKEYPSVISEKIHRSRDVERMNAKGKYIIKKLFQAYYSHPQQLPDGVILKYMIDIGEYHGYEDFINVGVGSVRVQFHKVMPNASLDRKIQLMRAICDHIASMTDHYAIEEYENLYG